MNDLLIFLGENLHLMTSIYKSNYHVGINVISDFKEYIIDKKKLMLIELFDH